MWMNLSSLILIAICVLTARGPAQWATYTQPSICDVWSGDVSVLLPVYNKGHYLNESISSIHQLPENPFLIVTVIFDDGSQDNSLHKLRHFQNSIINFWLFASSCSRGTHSARISLVLGAMTPWLIFLDPDDILIENGSIIALQLAIFRAADIVQFGCLVAWPALRPVMTVRRLLSHRCWGDRVCINATGLQLFDLLRRGFIDWHLHRKVFRVDLYKRTLLVMPPHVKYRRNSRGQDLLHYLWLLLMMTRRYYFVDEIGEIWYDSLPDNSAQTSYQTDLAKRRECEFVIQVSQEFFGWHPTLETC
jgi:glycosyltransferase involved in cell wall biosynthesis